MKIYEVLLNDGSKYEPYEDSVGLFDSEEKAKEAIEKIKELIRTNHEDHCVPIIRTHECFNELDKETLEYWNLCED